MQSTCNNSDLVFLDLVVWKCEKLKLERVKAPYFPHLSYMHWRLPLGKCKNNLPFTSYNATPWVSDQTKSSPASFRQICAMFKINMSDVFPQWSTSPDIQISGSHCNLVFIMLTVCLWIKPFLIFPMCFSLKCQCSALLWFPSSLVQHVFDGFS